MIIEHGPPGARGVTQLQYVGDEDGDGSRAGQIALVAGVVSAGVAVYGLATRDRELKRIGGTGAVASVIIGLLSG